MRVHGVADDGSRIAVEPPMSDGAGCDSDWRDELRRRWPPFGLRLEEVGDDDVGGIEMLTRAPNTSDVGPWDRLESDLGLFAVERLTGLVAVHAATLVIDGSAMLLPGRSHAGKTTLALALAEAGATLASDEYALVDREGRVTGWPRPARVRLEGTDSRRVPVAAGAGPVPVGSVALLRYDPALVEGVLDVATPSRADAVVAVLDETVCARSRPDESLDAALSVTAAPRVLRGRRGEAASAAAALIAHHRAGPSR